MQPWQILIHTLALVSLLTGCSALPLAGGGLAEVRSSQPRQAASAPAADVQTLVRGNTAFGAGLYQALRSTPGNLFFSPYSISAALAMAQAGARAETRAQMNRALHFSLPDAALHPAFNALQLTLSAREQNEREPAKKDFQLKLANAAWGQRGRTFSPEYLDQLARSYGSGLRPLDFQADPETARQTINNWVADSTEQRIKDLIARGLIDRLTTLVLTNAVYFKAAWQAPFTEQATAPGVFHNLDGRQVSVPVMNAQGSHAYAAGPGWQALELAYQSGKLGMWIILPDAGQFTAVEGRFDAALLDAVRAGLKPQTVRVALPKFRVESSFGLAEALQKMGMTDAFQAGRADFSGMDGTRELFISSVVHKAFVEVDEKGTEAAAATAVIIGRTSMPVNVQNFVVDRPFLFLIRDLESGTVLFMGRVTGF